MTVFWDVSPSSLFEVDRHFRGSNWLHHRPNDGGSTQKTAFFIDILDFILKSPVKYVLECITLTFVRNTEQKYV
jgi:hypothetical protein